MIERLGKQLGVVVVVVVVHSWVPLFPEASIVEGEAFAIRVPVEVVLHAQSFRQILVQLLVGSRLRIQVLIYECFQTVERAMLVRGDPTWYQQ